jgi:predicted RNase H-like HicB family nuclease
MATFIAIVKRDGDAGYTASFPDFPACAVEGPTIDLVIAKAREALSMHIERLLEAHQRICIPTAAGAIDLGDALLLAAVDVPDDLRIAHVDLAIPALSLARIDAFAQRHGLTLSALFVEAVNRWAAQETVPRERRAGVSDGPTLFDFGNPLDLRVEAITAAVNPPDRPASHEPDTGERADTEANLGDITAELVRLLEGSTEPPPTEAADDDQRNRLTQKRE